MSDGQLFANHAPAVAVEHPPAVAVHCARGCDVFGLLGNGVCPRLRAVAVFLDGPRPCPSPFSLGAFCSEHDSWAAPDGVHRNPSVAVPLVIVAGSADCPLLPAPIDPARQYHPTVGGQPVDLESGGMPPARHTSIPHFALCVDAGSGWIRAASVFYIGAPGFPRPR